MAFYYGERELAVLYNYKKNFIILTVLSTALSSVHAVDAPVVTNAMPELSPSAKSDLNSLLNTSKKQGLKQDLNIIVDGAKNKQAEQDVDTWLKTLKSKKISVDNNKARGDLSNEKGVNLDALMDRYNKADFASGKSETDYPKLIAMVSLGMPKNSLVRIVKDAHKSGGRVIIRGMLEGNNLKKTAAYIQDVIVSAGTGRIDIDPRPFRTFKVDRVPAFVVTKQSYSLCKDTDCKINTPVYDKLSGNVSLQFALQHMVYAGELDTIAQSYLDKLDGVQ